MGPMNRSVVTRMLMGLLVSAVALMALEGGARLVLPPDHEQPASDNGHMQPDALLGWSPRPGQGRLFGSPRATHINALGTRNPELQPRQAGEKRLLTLGDSTVFGALVNDENVFSAVAAQRLSQQTGLSFSAFNGGIPGYSSEQSRRLLEHRLADVGFDYLIIATLWSDSQFGDIPDAMMFPERVTFLQRALNGSGLFRLLSGVLNGWRPIPVEWRLQDTAGGRRVPLSAYTSNLHQLADLARARGAEPIYLMLPSDRDLSGQPLEEPRPAYRQAMASVAAAENALLVDGAQPFVGGPRSLMADDVHPSASGHRLLGETLADAMHSATQPSTP